MPKSFFAACSIAGVRRVVSPGDGVKAARHLREFVAVRIPDIDNLANASEERTAFRDLKLAAAVFALRGVFDLAAELMRHELHTVANAEDWQPEIEDRWIGMRRLFSINAGGAAAEDQALRMHRRDFFRGRIEGDDLRINLALAHATRDDLRVLRAEVENDDPGNGGLGHVNSRRESARESLDRRSDPVARWFPGR